MMPFDYHPEARQELVDAVDYIEEHRPGWGKRLQLEVESAIDLFRVSPKLHPIYNASITRRCVIKKFHYTVFYVERASDIVIVAFAHHRRRPGYWLHRLEELEE